MNVPLATLAALGSLALVSCNNDVTKTTPVIKPESLELVNVIKEDLRKNNDDYEESLGVSHSSYVNLTMKPAAATTAPEDGQVPPKHRFHLGDTRRQGAVGWRQGPNSRILSKLLSKAGHNANSQKPGPADAHSVAERLKPHGPTTKNFEQNMRKATDNKEKADKLKMFIQKNRGMLQEFLKKRKAQTTKQAPQMRAAPLLASAEFHDQPELKMPAPHELDMLPAVGARVHNLRMKGHFCHRNLMIPEGPKYDSKGNVYLAAYDAKPRKFDYPQTALPNMLLPKCCNCCKKSVLGCE